MKTGKFVTVGIVASIGLILLSGCFFGMPQQVGDRDQGGSSPTQATSKFLNDQWGEMNPDDIQMLVQIAPDVIPELEEEDLPEINDDQAETFVNFLEANNVETQSDLQAVIEQAQDDPNSIENYDEVKEVLETLAGQAGA